MTKRHQQLDVHESITEHDRNNIYYPQKNHRLGMISKNILLKSLNGFNRNFLTAKLLKQGYRYHKIRKAFSRFYHRHSELIVKYKIGLKTLLQQGISEPIFYGDLVYKFKRIVGKPNFSDQFKKLVKRYI